MNAALETSRSARHAASEESNNSKNKYTESFGAPFLFHLDENGTLIKAKKKEPVSNNNGLSLNQPVKGHSSATD